MQTEGECPSISRIGLDLAGSLLHWIVLDAVLQDSLDSARPMCVEILGHLDQPLSCLLRDRLPKKTLGISQSSEDNVPTLHVVRGKTEKRLDGSIEACPEARNPRFEMRERIGACFSQKGTLLSVVVSSEVHVSDLLKNNPSIIMRQWALNVSGSAAISIPVLPLSIKEARFLIQSLRKGFVETTDWSVQKPEYASGTFSVASTSPRVGLRQNADGMESANADTRRSQSIVLEEPSRGNENNLLLLLIGFTLTTSAFLGVALKRRYICTNRTFRR